MGSTSRRYYTMYFTNLFCVFPLLLLLLPAIPHPVIAEDDSSVPAIAIIIDDLGNRRPQGIDALSLPGPVTYAILPHTPFATYFANDAFTQGKEVILHQPMESTHGKALGPGGLTENMSEAQVLSVLHENLSSIPHISGLNNHMGSLLSAQEQPIDWMMQAVASLAKPLFFVDSRTTPQSVIATLARRNGVATITRDVFLDNSKKPHDIRMQFLKLVERAKSRGTALAIGHPYNSTIEVLKQELANLSNHGVRLVKVSRLIELRRISRDWTAMQPEANKAPAARAPRT